MCFPSGIPLDRGRSLRSTSRYSVRSPTASRCIEGVIAVAVESAVKTDPGQVVFLDRQLRFLGSVQVGALPDMLTFSPDGRWLLVANEGEPSADYTVDPEGSVSIVDLRRGAAGVRQSDVRTVSFTSFNNVALDPSIRIFGPNATVAQDIEPEYIAVAQDSRTAWVTCQENNALAVIDIRSATVTKLVGLGFKDHRLVETKKFAVYQFNPAVLPSIGATAAGQELFLGGFSGLHFEGIDPRTGRYKFLTHTDRGPNAEPNGINRPFLLPGFTPEIVRFELDRKKGILTLTERLPLKNATQGHPLTGLPNIAINDSGNTPYNDEKPVDLFGECSAARPAGRRLRRHCRQPGGRHVLDGRRVSSGHLSFRPRWRSHRALCAPRNRRGGGPAGRNIWDRGASGGA